MDSFTLPFCVLIHYLIFGHCAAFDETATILPDQMLLNDLASQLIRLIVAFHTAFF